MSRAASGQGGSGSTVVYTFAAGESGFIETLRFKVTTDATTGTHSVRVILTIPTVGEIARLDDLNTAGPSQTNWYTFGLGLNASACTLTTGLAVTDALPETELTNGATVTIVPIDATGATLAGDVISDVFLQLSSGSSAVFTPSKIPITLLPGAAAA